MIKDSNLNRTVLRAVFSMSLLLIGLISCAAPRSPAGSDVEQFLKKQETAMSRSSYEQLQSAVDRIKVRDTREQVLSAVPQKEEGKAFELKRGNQLVGIVFDYNWPGVLTPFNAQSYLNPKKLDEMHLGYLENGMLRLKKVILFKEDRVAHILSFSTPNEALESGEARLGKKIGLTGHMSKDYYEKIFLPRKDRIVPGMYVWEMFDLLGANYMRDGQSYVTLCPSFLNYKTGVKTEKSGDSTRAIYPFGYLEGEREVIKWQVETVNGRVTAVKPSPIQ
jgi:hypothetical protein